MHVVEFDMVVFSTVFFFFIAFEGPPAAYGGSQARGLLIGAAVAGLCHSHSQARSEPHL